MRARLGAGIVVALAGMVLLGPGALAAETAEKPSEKAVAASTGAGTTVAVLAFKNLCGDTTLDWLGIGFAESLSTKLSNVSGIQLVERTRLSDALKELKLQDTGIVDANTAGKLGKIIGAKFVILGSFQKAGDAMMALRDVQKVISLNPKLPEAYFSRAMCKLGGTPPAQLTQMLTMMGIDAESEE